MSEQETNIELAMDKLGVSGVLHAMATICSEKAEHIRANWQDEDLAAAWDKKGAMLDKFAEKIATGPRL